MVIEIKLINFKNFDDYLYNYIILKTILKRE